MKKIISLILSLALLIGAVPINTLAAENPYICHNYSECTADGSEIFEVIDDCPVRAEPTSTSSGKVLARLEVGDFVSVKETVFNAKRLSRWARIEYPDGEETRSAYVFIGNLEKHAHRMTTLAKDGRDNLRACYRCGHAILESDGEVIIGNINSIVEQAVLGDFSNESTTILGFLARCVASECPLADARDIISDLWYGRSWEVVLFDAAGFFPIISIVKLFVKNVDMLPEFIRHSNKLLKNAPEFVNGVYRLGKYDLPETVLTTFIYGNGALNKAQSGIQGAHNMSAFMDSLKNVNGSVLQKAAHSTVEGIYNVAYTFEKADGATATARIAKTVYDPDKISDLEMMTYMLEAFSNPIKVPGTSNKFVGMASNGLWFEGSIDEAVSEIQHIFISLENLGAKYGINY